MDVRWYAWRDRLVVAAAVVLPPAFCAALVPFRSDVPNTDAALALVVVVVAVSAPGHRLAGTLASVSGAVWFDFFLTPPYESLRISGRRDVETFVLLVAVGLTVTELSVRGRRSRLLAETDERYLDAINATSAVAESASGPTEITTVVCDQLTTLLALRACRFETTRYGGLPRLEADGRLRHGDGYRNVDDVGFPDHEIELLGTVRGRVHGRFVLTPHAGQVPSLAARKCAVIVVKQAAAALADTSHH